MSRILVVDDHEPIASGLALMVDRMGHEGAAANSGAEAIEKLRERPVDLLITDYRMEKMDGLQLLEVVVSDWPDTDVIINTAHGTIEIAVEAMKLGAVDFITKDLPREAIRLKIERVLEYRLARRERQRLDEENQYLRDEIGGRYNFGEIVGQSSQIRDIMATVEKVAGTESSVLIYGESGTGKELVARALHYQSGRTSGPFVKVNCGALPHDLLESELFGHEKGAFTGAVRQKKGKFELAKGGTIFLDEIGDIPLDSQVKLLRILQEKQFDRVGGEQTLEADIRVVAATNRTLKEMVKEGTFREDLFYRLEVIPINIPPLRERRSDIPALVELFLRKKSEEMNMPSKELAKEATDALSAYAWPGNVRELENVIERTLVLSDGDEIGIQDLPIFEGESLPAHAREAVANGEIPLNKMLDDLERELIEKAMNQSNRVKTRAAEILGIKTSALYYKLDKYGLE